MECNNDNRYGSECLFKCHIGYTMTGSARRVCERDPATSTGFWTGNETKCESTFYVEYFSIYLTFELFLLNYT